MNAVNKVNLPEALPAEFKVLPASDRSKMNSFYKRAAKLSKYNILVPLKGGVRALLYNTLNKSFALLNAKEVVAYKNLVEGETVTCDETVSYLADAGFLVEVKRDETADLKKKYWARRADTSGLSITIAPTLACNVACHYCFQGLIKPTGKMTEEVQNAVVDHVRLKASSITSLNVCWYGGEPLMDQKAILRLSGLLLDVCKENNISYSADMVTNGYLLDARVASKLLELGVRNAQVTIDGTEKAHDVNRPLTSGRGTYEKTIKNLKEVLSQTDFGITVRCNVGKDNADSMFDLIDELHMEGFTKFSNFGMYFYGIESASEACADAVSVEFSKAEMSKLQLQLQRKAIAYGLSRSETPPEFEGLCVASSETGFVMGPQGEIHRCWETLHDKKKEVGTIFDMNAALYGAESQKWLQFDPFDNPVCSGCKVAPMCAGFCAYKFIHPDSTNGEAGSLPCPKWKFNTAEYIFMLAESMGYVTPLDWDENQSTLIHMHAGPRHTTESVAAANAVLMEKAITASVSI